MGITLISYHCALIPDFIRNTLVLKLRTLFSFPVKTEALLQGVMEDQIDIILLI